MTRSVLVISIRPVAVRSSSPTFRRLWAPLLAADPQLRVCAVVEDTVDWQDEP